MKSYFFTCFSVLFLLCGAEMLLGQTPEKDQQRRDSYLKKMETFRKDRDAGKTDKAEILFIGSSSFNLYEGFEEDFGDVNAVNLGFGGSQMSDVLYFFDELVMPYHPQHIFVYEGDNDLTAGLSVKEFMEDVHAFVRLVRIHKPGTLISFLAPKPSPSRRELTDKYDEASQALFLYAKETPGVEFIDIASPMYRKDGKIRPDIWKQDSLHMNRVGYEEIWAPILQAHIRE